MTATWKCLISWVMEERNKQQQFFFSEYYSKKSIQGDSPIFDILSKRNKCTEVWENANSFSGFAQSLQFLKKSLEICPAIFQTWKKCDKVKYVFVFVLKFESWKKHLFLLFLKSLSITDFDNLESQKRNCCFGKSLERVLISGSKKPVTNPDFKSDVMAAVIIVYANLAPSYGWMGVCSIDHVKLPYSNVPANKYNI